ncbi:MAG: glycogen synthase GlgA [Acidobacteria bacterium]|nr:glycogen synthase GlgA [Acidobacteriota bacterium]
MLASEAEPYSKTGGLADVVGSLSRTLAGLGHEVGVVLPLYQETAPVLAKRSVSTIHEHLAIPLGKETRNVAIRRVAEGGVSWFFVDDKEYFDRPGLYGTSEGDHPDNPQRFTTLVRAALAIAASDFPADVLHCHDWQTGLAPALIKSGLAPGLPGGKLPVLFTIHNLGYDGLYDPAILPRLGLPDELFHVDGLEFHGKVSFLKAGLLYSGKVSTVSEAYSREIITPEFGLGKEGIIIRREADLIGILNGVDYAVWNPEIDPLIAAPYSIDDLSGKRKCKRDLLAQVGLPAAAIDVPLIGIVSRLAWQKGLDIVAGVANEIVDLGAMLVILGTGEAALEKRFALWSERLPDRIAARLAYDNRLAHMIEAGADVFLMPSRYEPCGLNQMYSLKYGTVPIVRATGGLLDTVEPWDRETWQGNGFHLADDAPQSLVAAVKDALAVYKNRDAWSVIMRNGMTRDYSWERSAGKYVAVYRELASSGS